MQWGLCPASPTSIGNFSRDFGMHWCHRRQRRCQRQTRQERMEGRPVAAAAVGGRRHCSEGAAPPPLPGPASSALGAPGAASACSRIERMRRKNQQRKEARRAKRAARTAGERAP